MTSTTTALIATLPTLSIARSRSGRVFATSFTGIYELSVEGGATDLFFEQELTSPAPLCTCGESLVVARGVAVFVVSPTAPLVGYLRTVKQVFDAAGLQNKTSISDMIAKTQSAIAYLDRLKIRQENSASGYTKKGQLQGPAGFINNVTARIIELLKKQLPVLEQASKPHWLAKAAQEAVVENMFSMIVHGSSLALTHLEFAVKWPRVGQAVLTRAMQGQDLINVTNKMYSPIRFQQRTASTTTALDFGQKQRARDVSSAQHQLKRFKKLAGGRHRMTRVRMRKAAPLGTKARVRYTRLKPAAARQQTTTETSTAADTGVSKRSTPNANPSENPQKRSYSTAEDHASNRLAGDSGDCEDDSGL